MRKLGVFIFALLVVFVVIEIGFCNGDGGNKCTVPPPTCTDCKGCPGGIQCDDSCSSGSLTSSREVKTWYYANGQQKSYTFGSKQYYSSPPTFTDKKYVCEADGTESNCAGSCTNYYDTCDSKTISCKEWQECLDDDNSGCRDDSTGCKCVDDYCKGWCMDHALVYDGIASCNKPKDGDWAAIGAFPSKPEKYVLHEVYHPANMNGGCYCDYYEIKDYYQCDSAIINDSHPCASKNCAFDFTTGRAYCCPDGGCAYNPGLTKSEGDSGICYSDGSVIFHNGYKLRCNNGKWEFDLGCGETIFNFQFYYDKDVVYRGEGYKGPFSVLYPLEFEGSRIVKAYVHPLNSSIKIQIVKNGNVVNEEQGDKVASASLTLSKSDKAYVRIVGTGEYDLHVECYIPYGDSCSGYGEDNCLPDSYCAEDNINNVYYCCHYGECSFNGQCYSEGIHSLGGSENWKCLNGKWSKLDRGEECNQDNDCKYEGSYSPEEYNLVCVSSPDRSGKFCCEEGKCAIGKGYGCVEQGYMIKLPTGICVCDVDASNKGIWKCINSEIRKDYSRVLFTKEKSSYFAGFDISDLEVVSNAEAKLYLFFDKGNYRGNIRISVTDQNGNSLHSENRNIENKIEIDLGNINPGSGNGEIGEIKIEISSNVAEDEYFLYLGAVLVLDNLS